MAKATGKSADDLILQALETTLQRGGEVRLVKFGSQPENSGLFSDEKGTRKTAIERCLAGDQPLLKVNRTEKVKNKEHRFVTLTAEGLERLLSALPAERTADLLTQAIQQASEQVKGMEDQLTELLQRKREALAQVEKLLSGVVQRVETATSRLTSEIQTIRQRRDRLQEQLSKMAEMPPQGPKGPAAPPPPKNPQPVTDEDYAFVRRFAGEMVTAWQEETDPQVKDALERSLVNSGVTQIGTPGERTSFSGQYHESSEPVGTEPVWTGDPVEIVQPGWMWEDGQRAYLLALARIRKPPP